LTFIAYSSGFLALQDSYYHWFRDIAGGKITDLNNNFYRIVVNEHLLLVPILLYFVNKVIKNKNKFYHFIILSLLFIFSLNLTRIYILAHIVGLIFLFSRQYWKRWLFYSFGSILIFVLLFSAIHLVASRGQSFGWELLGLRIGSIASPSIEESSLSRMMLLPKILDKIKQKPFWGNGMGDTVTVYSPVIKKEITTTQFDWGYLEIIDEMGIMGMLIWLSLITYILYQILKIKDKKYLLAILSSILIINLTSPALFHVLGIILLIILIIQINHYKYEPI
jgi:O-antigen ligase